MFLSEIIPRRVVVGAIGAGAVTGRVEVLPPFTPPERRWAGHDPTSGPRGRRARSSAPARLLTGCHGFELKNRA
jgi:hypothetical protein